MYQLLMKRNSRDDFPNMEVSLCKYITLTISNCCGERYCSKLRLIKDEHQYTMSRDRLVHPTMFSMEWDTMRRVNVDKILWDFSGAQKRAFIRF